MLKNHFTLSIIFILIIVLIFILPHLTSDIAVSAKGELLSSSKYLFLLNIYMDILSKIIAAVSLLGLLYQFKRDKNINEAEFVLNINNSFITNKRITRIYKRLEKSKNEDQQTNPFSEDDIIDIADYLSFFEPFYGLITQKVVHFSSIDQLSYRFFLVTNNRFVQEMLLCKEGKEIAWKDLYKLHHKWRKFRTKKNNYTIWQEERDLSKCPKYQCIISKG